MYTAASISGDMGFTHNNFVDTEIDFTTYMRQIDVYITGELDYSLLKGPSGPLVYALSWLCPMLTT